MKVLKKSGLARLDTVEVKFTASDGTHHALTGDIHDLEGEEIQSVVDGIVDAVLLVEGMIETARNDVRMELS